MATTLLRKPRTRQPHRLPPVFDCFMLTVTGGYQPRERFVGGTYREERHANEDRMWFSSHGRVRVRRVRITFLDRSTKGGAR